MSQSALTSPGRLRKIDQLRERNIATHLPLPQLVAVGDQSSGKSSLLENLTGIPFPRGQELCTRYVTQITHSRDTVSRITVSIIPGPDASSTHKERLQTFVREVETTGQLHAEFPNILNEVNALMDIKTTANPGGSKTFAEDILKIERRGPDEDYLTVIDVPGIFRIKTEGVTTERDRGLVEKMVKNYIRDSRTIILAVLPCNVDVATQEILAFAEEVDKTGERTLGILTKPDLVNERSAKAVVCNLVMGKRRPLTLGYYIVRNRGGDDDNLDGDANPLEREEIFREDPWASLPEDRVGIEALRERLQELLGQITDKAFPKLRSEIRHMLAEKQEELTGLGPSRQTERQQQQFLAGVAGRFQAMVRAALDADYSADEAFTNNNLRLVTEVINITEEFNDDFKARAHTYTFGKDLAARNPSWLHTTLTANLLTPRPTEESTANPALCGIEKEEGDYETGTDSSNQFDHSPYPDLEGVLITDRASHEPVSGIMSWITDMHRRSRGVELGTFGPRILSSAFQGQSEHWHKMTGQYVSNVILSVHKFILGALAEVCTGSRVRDELTSSIMTELLDRYHNGMKHAMYLVDIERQKKPYTLNHYFNDNLQKARGNRACEALEGKSWKEKHGERLVVALSDVSSVVSNRSNVEHTAEDIHDILQAYYKVARKRFVDNVYHQAVDHCLLSGPSNPLALFCEQWVLQLDTEKLHAIAGESRATTERRSGLGKTLEDLEEAMKILG